MSHEGLKGPSLDLGGPAPAKVSIGGELNLSPLKLLTLPLQVLNPVKFLKTLGDMVGDSKGLNPLEAPFGVSEQLSSLVRGNPKIFLKQAFGGGAGASGPGDSVIGAASNAMGSTAQKGIEAAGSAAGKGVGLLSNKVLSGVGGALQAIPVVGTAAGVALKAAAPVVDQAMQQMGKVAGKVVGRVVKQAMESTVKAVQTLVRTAIKKAITAGVRRGPVRVTARSRVPLKGGKPPIIPIKRLTSTILEQVQRALDRAKQGVRVLTAKRTAPFGQDPKSLLRQALARGRKVGGFAARTARSGVGAVQSSTQAIDQLSQVGEKLGRGQVDEAGKALQGAGGSLRGAGRAAAAPAKEGVQRAWQGRGAAKRAVSQRVLAPLLSQPPGARAASGASRTLDLVRKPAQGLANLARKPGEVIARVKHQVQPLAERVKSATAPMRKAYHRVASPVKKVVRIASVPAKAAQASAGVAADTFSGVKGLAQAPTGLSGAAQAMAKGDASAALSQAHGGVSGLTAAPDALSSGASRLHGLKALRGAPRPLPSHFSPAGQNLWGQTFQGDPAHA